MMGEEDRRLIEASQGTPKEMTFDEWLESATTPLPEGFTEWKLVKPLWDNGKAVDWAISKFNKHPELRN